MRDDRGADARNCPEQGSLFVHLTGGRQNLLRDMLVQERLGGANAQVGMEPPPHRIVI